MKPKDEERFYKELAERYIEREGAQYRQELAQQPPVLTPRLDRRVHARQHTFARAVDKRKSPAIYRRCTYSDSHGRPFFT